MQQDLVRVRKPRIGAVGGVAHDWYSPTGSLDAQLVGAAGFWPELQP